MQHAQGFYTSMETSNVCLVCFKWTVSCKDTKLNTIAQGHLHHFVKQFYS